MIYHAEAASRVFVVEISDDGQVLSVDKRKAEASWTREGGRFNLILDRRSWTLDPERCRLEVSVRTDLEKRLEQAGGSRDGPRKAETVKAPMPGIVTRVAVAPGQAVSRGDLLLVLEAMKMANEVCARTPAVVRGVSVTPGQAVSAGDTLVTLE